MRTPAAFAARGRLFGALEAAFPVTFRADEPGAPAPDAVIVIAEDPGALAVDTLTAEGLPVLVVADAPGSGAQADDVRVSADAPIDPRLRDIVLTDRLAGTPLAPDAGRDDVLAVAGGGAVWTRSRGPAPVDTVRCALPELAPDQVLSALLWRHSVVAVALVSFLRAVSARCGWESPPVRAAFLFDDPNLRWRSYGFIDYRDWPTTPTRTVTTPRWR